MTASLDSTALDIVKKAFAILRVRDRELPLDGNDRQAGFEALNYFIKHMQNQGFHLWTKTEAVLPLVANQKKYKLGATGDYCFKDDDFYYALLSADASGYDLTLSSLTGLNAAPNIINYDAVGSLTGWTGTDATLSVSSGLLLTNTASSGHADFSLETTVGNEYIVKFSLSFGSALEGVGEVRDIDGSILTEDLYSNGEGELRFTARQSTTTFRITNDSFSGSTLTLTSLNYIDTSTGDYIAVILDDGNIQWSRVNYIAGSVVTMRDQVNSAASSGNYVYHGTSLIDRPLNLINCRYQNRPTCTEIPCDQWARSDYFDQPDKTSQGTVSQWYYDPQLVNGDLYVWQVAQSNQELLKITYIRPTDINEDNAESPDFPSEWFLTLAYNVADTLLAEYSVPDQRIAQINQTAQMMLMDALGHDNEDDFIQITPGRR